MAGQKKAKTRTSKASTSKQPASPRRPAVAKVPDRTKSPIQKAVSASSDPASPVSDEKYVVLNIERDPTLDYYVKTSGPGGRGGGDVWATSRPQPGASKIPPMRITALGFHVDWDRFNYFVDADGDVSRTPRRWRRKPQ